MPHRDFTGYERVLTQGRVQLFYLSLLELPLPSRLNLEHDFELSRSLLEPVTTLFAVPRLMCILAVTVRLIPSPPARRFPFLDISSCTRWSHRRSILTSSSNNGYTCR